MFRYDALQQEHLLTQQRVRRRSELRLKDISVLFQPAVFLINVSIGPQSDQLWAALGKTDFHCMSSDEDVTAAKVILDFILSVKNEVAWSKSDAILFQ